MTVADDLAGALPPGVLVTDPDIIDAYRCNRIRSPRLPS